MSVKKRTWKAASFLSVTALALMMGCQDFRETFNLKPLAGVVPRISAQIGNTSVNGAIVDAKTGQALGDVRVTVTVSGADAGRLVDADGNAISGSFSTKGSINLFLKGDAASASKPAKLAFSVVDPAGNYLSSAQQIQVIDSIFTFKVKLVNKNNPPADVKIGTGNLQVPADGKVTSEQTITVNGAKLIIPAGTQFTVNGIPAGGALQAVFSLGGAPGGATVAIQEAGGPVDAAMTTYGAASVNFFINGQPASFKSPLAIVIPAANIPFESTLFAMNAQTGAFTSQDKPFIVGGNAIITLYPGFSGFAIGKAEKSLCQLVIPVSVTDQDGNQVPFTYKIAADGGSVSEGSGSSKINYAIAVGKKATLTLFDIEGQPLGASETINGCNGLSQVVRTLNKRTVSVTVKAVVTCADAAKTPTIQVYPEGVVVEYGIDKGAATTYDFSAIIRSNQGVLTGLLPNTKYLARVSFQGSYTGSFQTTATNSTENISVPIKSGTEICR